MLTLFRSSRWGYRSTISQLRMTQLTLQKGTRQLGRTNLAAKIDALSAARAPQLIYAFACPSWKVRSLGEASTISYCLRRGVRLGMSEMFTQEEPRKDGYPDDRGSVHLWCIPWSPHHPRYRFAFRRKNTCGVSWKELLRPPDMGYRRHTFATGWFLMLHVRCVGTDTHTKVALCDM